MSSQPDTPADARAAAPRRGWQPDGPISLGITGLWLSVIVLLPLAAIAAASFDDGPAGFWAGITATGALESLGLTLVISIVVAIVNVFFGTIIAWVLVRDDFRGKSFVNAIIDLPFALPTIVASLVLLSLYGPNSPFDIHLAATQPGVVMALTFVTLPFVVRQVQPVLMELDTSVEEAAAVLGASNRVIWAKIVLPALLPAILSGAGLAFTRAIGEFGSVVLIGGNIPGKTQVASQYIQQQIEVDQPVNAAAVSVALLAIAFVVLILLRLVAKVQIRREGSE